MNPELISVLSMIPGIPLIYYESRNVIHKLPCYCYIVIIFGSILYHSYLALNLNKYQPLLLKIDLLCQQFLVYVLVLLSPHKIEITLLLFPFSLLSLVLCDFTKHEEQFIGLYAHALIFLVTSYILDYKITIIWIIAMYIFYKKDIYPRISAALWHTFNHICMYLTWHKFDDYILAYA